MDKKVFQFERLSVGLKVHQAITSFETRAEALAYSAAKVGFFAEEEFWPFFQLAAKIFLRSQILLNSLAMGMVWVLSNPNSSRYV